MPGGAMPTEQYGRPAQPPGVGANSKRHDLEAPKTPGLHGSDLQYGDVQRLEQAQSIAPIRTQPSAAPSMQATPGGSAPPSGGQPTGVPNPLDFLTSKLGNTLDPDSDPGGMVGVNTRAWAPLLKRLAASKAQSSGLRSVLVARLGEMVNSPYVPSANVVDLNDIDSQIEEMIRQ
ncbi:MAG: hypothetical protein PHQ43_08310 [Dehalococcoidales bacterium]|nr:hypothetical protein [Dehalococcoidales bacterium]